MALSQFYGMIPESNRQTTATARGTKASGLSVVALARGGGIRVNLRHNEKTGEDRFFIEHVKNPKTKNGRDTLILSGIIGEEGETQ